MKNVAEKILEKNQNTHFIFNNFFFFLNQAVYERMFENNAQPVKTHKAKWRMRISCWVTKATNTHTQNM